MFMIGTTRLHMLGDPRLVWHALCLLTSKMCDIKIEEEVRGDKFLRFDPCDPGRVAVPDVDVYEQTSERGIR